MIVGNCIRTMDGSSGVLVDLSSLGLNLSTPYLFVTDTYGDVLWRLENEGREPVVSYVRSLLPPAYEYAWWLHKYDVRFSGKMLIGVLK